MSTSVTSSQINNCCVLVGRHEGHLVCKKLHGYVSGLRCRFAYGLADATATHYLLLQEIQIGFTFLVLPFWCWLTRMVPYKIQEGCKMVVCVCVWICYILQ